MNTHEHACELHAAELVRVNEVADLVARLADPANLLALTGALCGRRLDHADCVALRALRDLCRQTSDCVDSYVDVVRQDAAA